MPSPRWAGPGTEGGRAVVLGLLWMNAAVVLGSLLNPSVRPLLPPFLFPLAVLLAAAHGGRWAGLLATALGEVFLGVLLPRGHPPGDSAGPLLFWLLYGVTASVLVGRLRQARHDARAAARTLAQREAEWRGAAQRQEEMDRNKDRFIDELAHELRNHLGPISMALPILKQALPPEPRLQRLCSTVERQLGLQARLVNDLMDSARIAQGKVGLQLERLDLAELVAHTAEDQQARVEAAGLTLTLKLPPHPVVVEGDPVRLVQVMTNLISNAIKFTDAGGRVTLWVSQLPDSLTAAIGVRDTGVGLEPQELSRVFSRFYQAEGAGGRPRGGLGLGLETVRRLVDLHHGTVQVHSRGRGQGAEFVCLLPLLSEAGERRFHGTLKGVQEVVQ